MKFKFFIQTSDMGCGPTCIKMLAKYYGKNYSSASIGNIAGYNKEGVTLLGLSDAAENIGFRTRGVILTYKQLIEEAKLPCILHWNQNHFVVLPPRGWRKRKMIQIADPAIGIVNYKVDEFLRFWISNKDKNGNETGIALLLEPSAVFSDNFGEKEQGNRWKIVFEYLDKSRWEIVQVIIALFITIFFQFIFPFLTQSIVDIGINTQNIKFVNIILLAQLMLIISRTIINFVRNRILLSLSIKINLSLVSDFWIKLTRLPISYFDSYHTGDTLQRLADCKKIENFLTDSSLNTIFSFLSFVVFAVILSIYDTQLFIVFFIGSIIYFYWIKLFLKLRRKFNYQNFHLYAKENSASLQLIHGMQELKLNNAENTKRWEWEDIQTSIFKLSYKNLSFSQLQQAGALLINEGKNTFITFLVAKMVIDGKLTLGSMLAVQYIIGQLNGPIEQFAFFFQSAQDTKISLERLNEIHDLEDEESKTSKNYQNLPENRSISFKNCCFTYPGSDNMPVLDNLNFTIPEGKTTAIVGLSGSGKTTLLKLLLKFYDNYEGEIFIGSIISLKENNKSLKFRNISHTFWRKQCGSVLQESYIFSDTIAHNIAVGSNEIDFTKLENACKTANIYKFIETLPNGYNTKIGADGVGLSQGQKQRILIARAIFKDPHYLFLDEATNSLDANNEKTIIEKLQSFFLGRTVVVVAHRLSTVKNADNIIVLHEGKIVEQGTHQELSRIKGNYYELVKNQLDLEN